jgi:predicted PurR-regulated permease PerM
VREILVEFRKVSGAVMFSSLATAAVQALAALAGYLIARVPHPFFFAFVTFLVAFVPAVGAAGVVLLAAGLLAVTGHNVAAIFLVIWALAVVGLVDNIIKPVLVKRGLELHGAIVFFALLGGLAVFGTIGLLLGPLIVAFFLALVRIHRRELAAPPPAAPEPPCV